MQGSNTAKITKSYGWATGVAINTHYRLDNTLGGNYAYELHYTNVISFDEPETVINALNLFLMNCTIGYLHGY